jgi:phage/plasmid-like protein (TIGR03299 family)
MVAAVESMAWTGDVPWHGLGNKVSNDLTPEQMLVAAGLDWTVEKQPLYIARGEQEPVTYERVKDAFGLVRNTDQRILSVVGKGYKPVQNRDALAFFHDFVVAGEMSMETAGSLQEGRHVWALARTHARFSIGKGKNEDEVDAYLLLSSPHIAGYSMTAMYTAIRVVCWNTYTAALRATSEETGKAQVFRMPHSRTFNEATQESAKIALGLAVKQTTEFKEAAILLSDARAHAADVEQFFYEVLRLDDEVLDAVKKGDKREPKLVQQFTHALTHAPGQTLATAEGTWWGAFNAVTAVADHIMGKTRDNGLRSAWIGDAAMMKRRAFNLAVDWAKAA